MQVATNVGTTNIPNAVSSYNQTDAQWIKDYVGDLGTLIGIYRPRRRSYFPEGTPAKKLLNRKRRFVYKAYFREVSYTQAEAFATRTQPKSWKWVPGGVQTFEVLYAAICRDDECVRRCPPGCNCEEGVCV